MNPQSLINTLLQIRFSIIQFTGISKITENTQESIANAHLEWQALYDYRNLQDSTFKGPVQNPCQTTQARTSFFKDHHCTIMNKTDVFHVSV